VGGKKINLAGSQVSQEMVEELVAALNSIADG